MSLIDELKDLKKQWSQLSVLAKVVVATALLCSALSLASLADHVFAFKGFIINALEGYRAVSGWIFGWLANLIDLNISQKTVDFIVLVMFMLGTWLKIEVPDEEVLHGKHFALRLVFIGPLIWILFSLAGQFVPYGVGFLVLPLATPLINPLLNPAWKWTKTDFQFLAFVLAIYIFVAVVAAISEGLMRSSV